MSAVWALADGTDRKEIEAAFAISTGAVVLFLQAEAVASRAGCNGVIRVKLPEGATVAAFDHWTSRAGDPHVHTHQEESVDGQWSAFIAEEGGKIVARSDSAMIGGDLSVLFADATFEAAEDGDWVATESL